MQATVKVNINDFNLAVFEKIKSFAQNGEFDEIIINFRPKNKKKAPKVTEKAFIEKIENSIKQVKTSEYVPYEDAPF
jgi:RNase H-fold protein (predicted Holliday junction resolvase)